MTDMSVAADLLREAELPTHGWAVTRLRDDLEIASEVAAYARSPILPKRRAAALEKAAARVLKDAEQFALATRDALCVVRLVKSKAELAQTIKFPAGPRPRPWLGPCVANFLDVWHQIATKSDAVYEGSPALLFVTECCRAVDSNVTESAVYRAIRACVAEDKIGDDQRARDYEAWQETPVRQKLREVCDLEVLLSRGSVGAGD